MTWKPPTTEEISAAHLAILAGVPTFIADRGVPTGAGRPHTHLGSTTPPSHLIDGPLKFRLYVRRVRNVRALAHQIALEVARDPLRRREPAVTLAVLARPRLRLVGREESDERPV